MLFMFLEPPFLFPWWNLWHKAKVPKVMGVVGLKNLKPAWGILFPSSVCMVLTSACGLAPYHLVYWRDWFLVCRALLLALCFRCFYYSRNDYQIGIKPSSWWCPPCLNSTSKPQQQHLLLYCAPRWSFAPSILLWSQPPPATRVESWLCRACCGRQRGWRYPLSTPAQISDVGERMEPWTCLHYCSCLIPRCVFFREAGDDEEE